MAMTHRRIKDDVAPGTAMVRGSGTKAHTCHPVVRVGRAFGSARTEQATSPALRILTAHLEMLSAVLTELQPAAVLAASDAAVELAKGVLADAAGEVPSAAEPTLAVAARQIVDEALADAHLTPQWVARELSVSERTLQRAFRDEGESLMAYVRRRRLEGALTDLVRKQPQSRVTEVAFRWGFSDSSHLIRVCRKVYGQTPTQYVRAHVGRPM
ncbi:helix-turn-helix domain-containing protein [Actinoplanes sp. M2I2]|uniref:helix-turn-helix domain-containing protein n=1 Tax=Actinoplanes sp. M2I2 TaxID=1734444 RepID=UPI002021A9F4|nr:helix-turn-helix domain-containing protein [Actinoplanes sp. M2I2]